MAGYEVTIITDGQAIGAGIEPALYIGPPGEQGERGYTGPAGPEGAPGPQGEKGDQSDTGLQGEPGSQGPQGEKGEPGTSFKLLGCCETLELLKDTHAVGQAGDAYAVGSATDNTVYLWDQDASAWVNVGPLQGPEGLQGPQGIQGEQGEPGERGPQGEKGADGEDGADGAPGEMGPQGEVGPQGPQGEPGVQGEQGPQGLAGANSAPGPNEVSEETATTMIGLLKGDGVNVGMAAAGTDYAAPDHVHDDALSSAGGTLTGTLTAGGTQDVTIAQVRNIYAGTADMTPGTTALETGTLYLMYE